MLESSSSSSEANPTLGHGCPNETTPDSPILRSVPGGEKADVGWSQVSLNSAGPHVCRSPSSPLPVPRLAVNGSVECTVVVQLWAGPGNMPKPVEPSGADDIGVDNLTEMEAGQMQEFLLGISCRPFHEHNV